MSEDTKAKARAQVDAASQKFSEAVSIGDVYFFLRAYSAWIVDTQEKSVVPAVRMYLADHNGSQILERVVLVSGLIDLIDELSTLVDRQATDLKAFEGFTVDLPAPRSLFLERLAATEAKLRSASEKLSGLPFKIAETDPSGS